MADKNNPAGRLLLLLRRAQKVKDDIKVHEGWARVLGVSPSSSALLFHKLGIIADFRRLRDCSKRHPFLRT